MWCHWLRLCALPVYFTKKFWETDETEVVFGRSDKKCPIILDLSPDQRY